MWVKTRKVENMCDKKINICDSTGYQHALEKLLLRYSKNGVTVFRKVENLHDFSGYAGIYILCFPSVNGYYVGKSKNIARRIPQHFKNPKTQFDRTFSFEEIQDIYVLHCAWDILDLAEVDCIATIPKQYLLNRMAGGPWIMFLDSEEYNPERVQVEDSMLQSLIDGVEMAKELDEFNIRYKKETHDSRTAAAIIRKGKTSKITPEMCFAAICDEGEILEYIPVELRTHELCLKAVGHASDPHKVLQFVPESIRNEEICLSALKYSDKPIATFKLVPKELLTEDFAEAAVKMRRSLLNKLPVELQTERVNRAAEPKRRKKK